MSRRPVCYTPGVLPDLHRHLEGSHSAAALADVAQAFDLRQAPFYDPAAGRFATAAELTAAVTVSGASDDPTDFYQCIVAARAAYVSVAAIAALAERAMTEAVADADGVELRLSLFSMARTLIERTGQPWRALAPVRFAVDHAEPILAAVIAARDRVVAATGRPILLRVGLSRTFESAPHYQALADVIRAQAAALVGLDVLGIVGGPDREPLPPAMLAIIDGLRPDLPDLTIHAGEFAGADSVARTLALAPQAIGHGVHSLDDPEVLAALARAEVTLEVCPTSNRLLIPTAVADLERRHRAAPLVALQAAGVRCVLGSDDPETLGTSFRAEVAAAHGFGVDRARLAADAAARWAALARA